MSKNSPWVSHVKEFASMHNLKYGDALRHPECKSTYTKGGNIFKKIEKGIKKSSQKVASYVVNDAKKDIQKSYKAVNKFALKNDLGGKVEFVKSLVPPEVVHSVMAIGLQSAGVDPMVADTMAASATGAVYNVDFGRSLKGQGDEAAMGALHAGVSAGIRAKMSQNKNAEGSGFSVGLTSGLASGLVDQKKLKSTVMKLKRGGRLSTNSFRGSGAPMSFSGGSFLNS